ncbi:unnamed protein product [Vitrella brassicaformis CCMP3155]|uniref:Uncharacterized protein n=1 Tax=Vitrella brassicaformis (strain CCMP3155) TaxID=1169540 RepID=A0A0G4EGQ8_VITBC|nr:unnamed protein product [Vitrella brassicaformis CCMP3155]|eukprot:CEL95432.1 unnamed protein product [Vitrella brassicaformis CCMP3155]
MCCSCSHLLFHLPLSFLFPLSFFSQVALFKKMSETLSSPNMLTGLVRRVSRLSKARRNGDTVLANRLVVSTARDLRQVVGELSKGMCNTCPQPAILAQLFMRQAGYLDDKAGETTHDGQGASSIKTLADLMRRVGVLYNQEAKAAAHRFKQRHGVSPLSVSGGVSSAVVGLARHIRAAKTAPDQEIKAINDNIDKINELHEEGTLRAANKTTEATHTKSDAHSNDLDEIDSQKTLQEAEDKIHEKVK